MSWTGTRVWFLLLTLGLVATTLAAAPVPLRASTAMQGAAVILPAAWVKMRLILRHCLGLARAPTRGGIFERVLGASRVLPCGIYVIPFLRGWFRPGLLRVAPMLPAREDLILVTPPGLEPGTC